MKLSVIGAGGHAKSVLALCETLGHSIHSLIIPNETSASYYADYPLVHEKSLEQLKETVDGLVIGIGMSLPQQTKRGRIGSIQNLGFRFPSMISLDSRIDSRTEIGEGTVVFAGVIVNRSVNVGSWSTLGHGAIIEHDSDLGSNCFVGPGAIVCGGVKVEEDVVLGAGSILLPGIKIGRGSIIGAGSVVTKDIASRAVVYGNPARIRNE